MTLLLSTSKIEVKGRDIFRMMKRHLGDIVYWIHAITVAFWIGLFFINPILWPNKIQLHFYLTLGIVSHQFLWGAALMRWTRKYRMVCILTTITQVLKGEKLSENYTQSFIKEFLRRIGVPVHPRMATVFTFAALTLISIQYFVF